MLLSLSDSLIILEHYKYLVILPVVIIEGPIIMIISGFLVYIGFLNVFITYPLLVFGDLIGDCIYYGVGKYGRRSASLRRIGQTFGYDQKIKLLLKNHFEKHAIKTLFLAKFSHGLGAVVQVTAGIVRVDFFKYFSVQVIGTLIKTFILLILGFYIGNSYIKIDTYLHSIAFIIIGSALFAILFFVFNKSVNKTIEEDK